MNQTADVVIVGGGLMGCSVAFHLARRGVDVTVLEKDSIGMGATGRSSAIIRQHYSNELTARMALHSLAVFEDFDERVGGECGFIRTGFLVIVEDRDRPGMEANVSLQRGVGIETRLLSPEDLQEVMPGIETADLVCAAYEPKSGYADPHMTTNGYAAAARRLGATFRVGQEVTGIRFEGDRVVGVDTENESFDAPIVVNCAGPWGAAVARMTGVDVPIVSSRVQVATFRRPSSFAGSHPIVIDFVHGSYFRSETGELTLVGSVDPSEADDVVDPESYPEHVDPEFVAQVGESFVRRYPSMERALSTGGYAGLYAVTPDWHPIVDEVPEGSGSFVCAGFSGHGFKLAPAVGEMTADLVTGAADPEFPPALFRFARYAEGDPVRGRYVYSITG
jgi:sarcosine oxidase subunit beta